jgi:GDPmannose 4,6-dehydratase
LLSALITGITGQDGFHLSEFLLKKNYRVFGLVRGQKDEKLSYFQSKFPQVELLKGDLTDFSSIMSVINDSRPDEIYNLGAVSFVGLSFIQPELTSNVTGLGILRILEAVKKLGLVDNTKIYQASSSEMFGKVVESPQNESSRFYPRSPYAVAKTFAHYTAINYREAYNMFVSCGILFNHEGEYRGHEFVTRKITSNLARIKLGLQENFALGNLDAKRDWGYAGDYVESMWTMLQQEESDTFVIATGKAYSIRQFIEMALEIVDLPVDLEKYVKFDSNLMRPSEVDTLTGDSRKAKQKLNWQPKTDIKKLIEIMIMNDLSLEFDKVNK